MKSALMVQEEQDAVKRDGLIEKLEASGQPGARVVARIIRKANAEDAETVMWSQNWNAHSRST